MHGQLSQLVQVVRLMAESFELEPLLVSIEEARRVLADQPELQETLEALVSIAVKRQRLLDAAREKERLESEMIRAGRIIAKLLPPSRQVAGYELTGWMQPAHLTGGDFYDLIDLGGGRVVFVLADAPGHGVDSTLLVTKFRAYVRALMDGRPLQEVSARLNQLLCRDEVYITACLGVLDTEQHRVEYVSAGQPILQLAGDQTVRWPVTGPPFGVDETLPAQVAPGLSLPPGHLLVLASDGLTDWRNPEGEFYGEKRLAQALLTHAQQASSALIQALAEDVRAFARGRAAQDDVTMLVLKRL